jgi:Protein of unknown function (DUF3106)
MHSRSVVAIAALLLCVGFTPLALAQGRRGGMNHPPPRPAAPRPEKASKTEKTPIDEFQTMSPGDRQKAMDRMPPAQRQKLEERLQKFNELPAEQQRALKNMYTRLHDLPPGRQDSVRKSVSHFSEQAPERRDAIRQELKSMGELPRQDRAARMGSKEFKSKFNHKEQDIIRDMSELLPPR